MSRQELTLGLFGFGVVGKGLWDVINQTPGLKAGIKRICVKNRDKPRSLSTEIFTYQKDDLINDNDINVIVELIDDADAAFEIVSAAMKKGKGVVSANKKMIAEHLEELLELQRVHEVPFLYEAACCASIPIIRNLEEYYDNDLLVSLSGIVNGSTNYILSCTTDDRISYAEALKLAQDKGYAESNPALDVEGFDAKYKLTILLAHAFGIVERPEAIPNLGIQRLSPIELRLASEKGFKIKLLAHARKLTNETACAFVLPQFVDQQSPFFSVNGVYNGVQTETSFADKQFFMGKGAGAFPTASAVLSDISALSYTYRYEYKKMHQQSLKLSHDFALEIFVSFNNKKEVALEDFDSISEQFQSVEGNYVIGKISFHRLISSEWFKSGDVSILLTPTGHLP
jgi:homoserine dehydrogenase